MVSCLLLTKIHDDSKRTKQTAYGLVWCAQTRHAILYGIVFLIATGYLFLLKDMKFDGIQEPNWMPRYNFLFNNFQTHENLDIRETKLQQYNLVELIKMNNKRRAFVTCNMANVKEFNNVCTYLYCIYDCPQHLTYPYTSCTYTKYTYKHIRLHTHSRFIAELPEPSPTLYQVQLQGIYGLVIVQQSINNRIMKLNKICYIFYIFSFRRVNGILYGISLYTSLVTTIVLAATNCRKAVSI